MDFDLRNAATCLLPGECAECCAEVKGSGPMPNATLSLSKSKQASIPYLSSILTFNTINI
eukprot:scaffold18345_cov76-Skeletonema_dohrnii-CCMP3373.AAC.3